MGLISKIYKSTISRREVYSKLDPKQKLRDAQDRPRAQKPIMVWVPYRFEVHNSYAIRLHLKKSGFRYDPDRKCWWTKSDKIAKKFKHLKP